VLALINYRIFACWTI